MQVFFNLTICSWMVCSIQHIPFTMIHPKCLNFCRSKLCIINWQYQFKKAASKKDLENNNCIFRSCTWNNRYFWPWISTTKRIIFSVTKLKQSIRTFYHGAVGFSQCTVKTFGMIICRKKITEIVQFCAKSSTSSSTIQNYNLNFYNTKITKI